MKSYEILAEGRTTQMYYVVLVRGLRSEGINASTCVRIAFCYGHPKLKLPLDKTELGAYWCDPAWKNYTTEHRPISCVLCQRPFKFHASSKTINKED